MLPNRSAIASWQGVALIATTYIYFLIFAQFAFLKRLAILGIYGTPLKAVMAAMAIGGILLSLLAPRVKTLSSPNTRIRFGLVACGAAAFSTLISLNAITASLIAFLVGSALGLLTVTLVANLRQWMGDHYALIKVGLGTGIGYSVCNIPSLFAASPQTQSIAAGSLCLIAACLPLGSASGHQNQIAVKLQARISFPCIVACFTALVWLDSAAFFIIQNTPALKAGTWQGSAHLWTNATIHLTAALASAIILRARGIFTVLFAAFIALGAACLLLIAPNRALLASLFYPIGVSFYSVALVAYPSLLAPINTPEQRGRQAGWIYAIAGWSGSALGIGMAQNLGQVPPVFVVTAGAVILLSGLHKLVVRRKRELVAVIVVLLVSLGIDRILKPAYKPPLLSQVERGRQVYISEGCISCHSQYVRPNSADVLMWGPVTPVQEIRLQHPPLIGNRRQGPDLSQVGGRRSALWLKVHFYSPAEVSGASIMPSFGFLFRDQRGDDLVAYLTSLRGQTTQQHISEENEWQLSPVAIREANPDEGEHLYQRYCATCHSPNGRTALAWRSRFTHPPCDLTISAFHDIPVSATRENQRTRIAQITKFGIPGTDMPGHEYLPDQQVASISVWLLRTKGQLDQTR
jgi:cytochrome c oxidase cbb3-type subunit 2